MSKIYTDLNTVLTPYATAIKKNASDITSLNGSLEIVAGWTQIGTVSSNADYCYPYRNISAVKVESEETSNLTIHGITVGDLDNMGTVAYRNCELVSDYTGKGKKYRVTGLSPAPMVGGRISGLTSGKTYRICLKVTNVNPNHYVQVLCNRTVRSTGNPVSNEMIYTTTFQAGGTGNDIYITLFAGSSYTPAVGDEIVIDDIYINEVNGDVDLYTHEGVFSSSVTGNELKYSTNGQAFVVSSTQDGSIYATKEASKVRTVNGISPDESGNIAITSHLQGKTCVCFGDSITERFVELERDYPKILAKNTGMNVINVGIGYTGMRYRDQQGQVTFDDRNKISFAHMADMIASGDFSEIEALGNQAGFETKVRCATVYPIISAIDWSEVDYITVAYGANDFRGDSTIKDYVDNPQDDHDVYTYLGAFRHAIDTILTAYPHIQIMVLTPVFRYWGSPTNNSDNHVFVDIHGSIYYYYWGDKLKECAENEYRIPVTDMYRSLSINGLNCAWFSSDGTHPLIDGIARMGSVLSGAVMAKF